MAFIAGSIVLFMLSSIMAAPTNQSSSGFLKEFQEGTCSIVKAVKVPVFESTSLENDGNLKKLMRPLDICKDSSLNDYSPLCEEAHEMLIRISTCQIHMEQSKHSEEVDTVSVHVREDVCLGFKEVDTKFRVDENFFSSFLKSQRMCEMTCQKEYESVCRVVLWAHEIQAKLFELLDVKPLEKFLDELRSGNCSFPNIEIPLEFRNEEKSYNLMESLKIPLQYCNNIIVYQKKQIILCYEIFRVLMSVSSCDSEIQKNENLKVQKEIRSDVCEGFRNLVKELPEDGKVVTYLDTNLVCQSLCSGEAKAVCQLLLWAHEIRQSLLVKPVDENISEGKVSYPPVSENGILDLTYGKNDNHDMDKISTMDNLNSNENLKPNKNAEENLSKEVNSLTYNNKENQTQDEALPSNDTGEKNYEDLEKTKKVQVPETPSDLGNTWPSVILPNSSTEFELEAAKKDISDAEKPLVNALTPEESIKDKATDFSYRKKDELDINKETTTVEEEKTLSVQNTLQDIDSAAVVTPNNTAGMNDNLVSPTVPNIDDIYSSSNSANSQTPEDSPDLGRSVSDDTFFRMNQPKISEQSYAQSKESVQEGIIEQESSHFFLYFLCIVALVTGCYIVIHNKQKVIALIVEGRHERRRRPHTPSYKKLNA